MVRQVEKRLQRTPAQLQDATPNSLLDSMHRLSFPTGILLQRCQDMRVEQCPELDPEMLGFILIPVVAKLLPELAVIVSVGLATSFVTAILCAWIAFLVIPAPPAPPDPHHHGGMNASAAAALAATMTIVEAPLLVAFLMFGWTDILILIYAALITTALSSEASAEMGWEKVVANLVIGGVGMLLFYEALVAVPNLAFMILETAVGRFIPLLTY